MKDEEKLECLHPVGGNIKQCSDCRKEYRDHSKKLQWPCDPAILSGICVNYLSCFLTKHLRKTTEGRKEGRKEGRFMLAHSWKGYSPSCYRWHGSRSGFICSTRLATLHSQEGKRDGLMGAWGLLYLFPPFYSILDPTLRDSECPHSGWVIPPQLNFFGSAFTERLRGVSPRWF